MYVHMCVHVHIFVIVDQWRSEDTVQKSVLPLQPIETQNLNQVIKLDNKTLHVRSLKMVLDLFSRLNLAFLKVAKEIDMDYK